MASWRWWENARWSGDAIDSRTLAELAGRQGSERRHSDSCSAARRRWRSGRRSRGGAVMGGGEVRLVQEQKAV